MVKIKNIHLCFNTKKIISDFRALIQKALICIKHKSKRNLYNSKNENVYRQPETLSCLENITI